MIKVEHSKCISQQRQECERMRSPICENEYNSLYSTRDVLGIALTALYELALTVCADTIEDKRQTYRVHFLSQVEIRFTETLRVAEVGTSQKTATMQRMHCVSRNYAQYIYIQ